MLRLGIVGLPNVGKSTLFNALTAAKALVANYPFATIEPNIGIVQVPDPRLDALARIVTPERSVPAVVEFVDIAGLVKGASEGEGLGNQFLANIREVDAIVHVVRCFEDADIQHVMGAVDPVRDREVINIELGLADLASVEKRLDRTARTAKSGDAQAKLEQRVLEAVREALAAGRPARAVALASEEETTTFRGLNLLTAKPVLYAANVAEDELAAGNEHVDALRAALTAEGEVAEVVTFSAKVEAELAELAPGGPGRVPGIARDHRVRARPPGPRGVPPPGPAELLHRRREGGPGVDHPSGRQGAGGGGRDSFGLREGLHPGGDGGVSTTSSAWVAGSPRASRVSPGPKARSTWSATATSCCSASAAERPRPSGRLAVTHQVR